MSIWTHVNGMIRIDALVLDSLQHERMLNNLPEIMMQSEMPKGSEGGLRYEIIEVPTISSLLWANIAFYGDLRDYPEGHSVQDWFGRLCNLIEDGTGMVIRQAVLQSETEGRENRLARYDNGCVHWELLEC